MHQAALFKGPGQRLELVPFQPPEPQGTELLVRVTCCTLCRSDLHTYAGRRIEPTPTVLGHEIVGRIEAFGPLAPKQDAAGSPVTVGSRVTWAVAVGCGSCFFCVDDLPQKCERPFKYGHQRVAPNRPLGGGLADYAVLVPGTSWFLVPDELTDAEVAPANCATATVAALLRYAGPVAGRKVLVLGAGVLGVTACAMARSAGALAVMASDPALACLERATAFGATHTLPTEPDELTARVAQLTDGRGADIVFELAGAFSSVEAGLTLVRTGGVLMLAGTVAPIGTIPVDPERLVRRMLTIRGVHNYHPRDLATALTFLSGPGRAFPFASLVCQELPLEQVEAAFVVAQQNPGLRVAICP